LSLLQKSSREEAILLTLKKFDFMTRSQLQRIHRLGGVRNANRVLKDLEPYVQTHRAHENVYFLSKEGRERVDHDKVCRVTSRLPHTLMRNEFYIYMGFPHRWENESPVSKDLNLIADAIYRKDNLHHFLEVDIEQKMSVNRAKIELYQKVFKLSPNFKLVWLTTTESRRHKIQTACKGLNCHVYTIQDIL
jgi:hypothetical protein